MQLEGFGGGEMQEAGELQARVCPGPSEAGLVWICSSVVSGLGSAL